MKIGQHWIKSNIMKLPTEWNTITKLVCIQWYINTALMIDIDIKWIHYKFNKQLLDKSNTIIYHK